MMTKRYQKTISLSNFIREECRSPSPPFNGSDFNDSEANGKQMVEYDFRYKSEIHTFTGKPYEKLIEIPVTREVFQTTPPISTNTTVMSYKQGCELFQSPVKSK